MALHFTRDEFAARRRRACDEMAKAGLDGLLIFRQQSMYFPRSRSFPDNLNATASRFGSMRSVWIAFTLTTIVTSLAFAGLDDVHAVIPGTFGVLTKCRGWIVTTTCKTYQHMRLPHRIAVGDTITLRFGSNPKEYSFPVARIDQKAGRCVIFSDAEGHRHRIDKINVPHCHRAV